jgi:hypothetical protein
VPGQMAQLRAGRLPALVRRCQRQQRRVAALGGVVRPSYVRSRTFPLTRRCADRDPRTNQTYFGTYRNIGPGAKHVDPPSWTAGELSAPISLETVLNTTSWIDPGFLKLQL